MESDTRLDSAVFQLTPTRTRYGLVINADGMTEKIASGLLDPFLAHLKEARDQVAKGGYSIILVPKRSPTNATWFTKATIQRFVRFVNTPEVLERVNTIESEGLQIEEAIAIQNNDNIGLRTVNDNQKKVNDYLTRSLETSEGSEPSTDVDAEKAVLIYEHVAHQPEFNGSTAQGENPKVHLLRVLETRKTLLQKEQEMAFARAVAAGFDMDHMVHLRTFAECFGASRLMEACLGFMVLWKLKHENEKWLQTEAAGSMPKQPNFSTTNSPNIMLSVTKLHKEFKEEQHESSGKSGMDNNATYAGSEILSFDRKGGKIPPGLKESSEGQFEHHMFSQRPVHSPLDIPSAIQPNPTDGISYPLNHVEFLPSYFGIEDPRFKTTQTIGIKRHSMDNNKSNAEAGTWKLDVSSRFHKCSALEKECSQDREQRRKTGRSGKNKSGMVVIGNINHITSRKRNSASDVGLQSRPASKTGKEAEDGKDEPDMKQNKSMRSSYSEGNYTRPTDTWSPDDNASTLQGQQEDKGKWQAFQNCLLRHNNTGKNSISGENFGPDKEVHISRQQRKRGLDPIVLHGQEPVIVQDRRIYDDHRINGNEACLLKVSSDNMTSQIEFSRGSTDGSMDIQLTEIQSGRGHKKATNVDFTVCKQKDMTHFLNSNSVFPTGHGFEYATNNLDRSSLHSPIDESYIVPLRSSSQEQAEIDRNVATDTYAAIPSKDSKDFSSKVRRELIYDPDDLKLMPMRGTEMMPIGPDPALGFEMRDLSRDAGILRNTKAVKEASKESKDSHKVPEKNNMGSAIRRGGSSKSITSNEEQTRANKLRSIKADPQKMKKNGEEEEVKRLESLKRERQRRITARSSSGPAQSTLPSQMKPQLHKKSSQVSYTGSKFSDSEPAKLSLLQRFPVKTASIRSSASRNMTKQIRSDTSGDVATTRSSRPVSFLSEPKKVVGLITLEPNITKLRGQIISEPKMNKKPHIPSTKVRGTDSVKLEPRVATDRVRKLSDAKTNNRHQASSINRRTSNRVTKPNVFDGLDVKQIPAILNHDRSRGATLPVLKTRSFKIPPDMTQNKMLTEESLQKTNLRSIVNLETSEVQRSQEKILANIKGEDKEVIEKTVVLENEMHLIPVVQVSAIRMDTRNELYNEHKSRKKNDLVTEYADIPSPASPLIKGQYVAGPSQLAEKPYSHKVMVGDTIEKLPKCSSRELTVKPDNPPYARTQLSALGGPRTKKLGYTSELLKRSEIAVKSIGSGKAHISDSADYNSSEKNPGSLDQSQGTEYSKGFKRLLKFGRKKNPPADMRMESDRLSMKSLKSDDYASNSAASSKDHTLKVLIHQGETLTGGAAKKVSGPLSLLSPFRSKTGRKLTI